VDAGRTGRMGKKQFCRGRSQTAKHLRDEAGEASALAMNGCYHGIVGVLPLQAVRGGARFTLFASAKRKPIGARSDSRSVGSEIE